MGINIACFGIDFWPFFWQVPNQLVGAPKGTNVTLECHTEAFPRAISYWVYDNMMILTTGKYQTESSEANYRTHMKLTIRDLREKDFAYRYRCLSKNSLGETEGSIRLYGEMQPFHITIFSMSIIRNTNLYFRNPNAISPTPCNWD